ncbi:MAG: hypothetical protein ACRDBL_05000 [Rhabdaerophilum sp.]
MILRFGRSLPRMLASKRVEKVASTACRAQELPDLPKIHPVLPRISAEARDGVEEFLLRAAVFEGTK